MPSLDEVGFIRQIKFFSALSDQETYDFLACCATREFEAGASIIAQGAHGDTMIIMRSGEAEVFITDANQGKVTLTKLGAGAVIGDMALVDPAPRSASIQALSTVSAYEIDRRLFAELGASRNPAFLKVMRSLAQLLCERLRATYGVLDEMLLPPEPPAAAADAGAQAEVSDKAPAQEPAAEEAAPKPPAVKQPAARQPAATQPAAKQPTPRQPAAKPPAAKEPAAKEAAVTEAHGKGGGGFLPGLWDRLRGAG